MWLQVIIPKLNDNHKIAKIWKINANSLWHNVEWVWVQKKQLIFMTMTVKPSKEYGIANIACFYFCYSMNSLGVWVYKYFLFI